MYFIRAENNRPPNPNPSSPMLSSLSAGLGLAGCLYGTVLTICGAVGLLAPCPWSSAAQCETLQNKASAVTQNGAIVLVVSAAAVVAANRHESV